jgi:alpha-ketoglutarate-dependent taurine dioxygenase
MLYIVILLTIINYSNCYQVTFPTIGKNYAVVSNINIAKLTDVEKSDFTKLFNSVPLIMFKNQKINPVEYYEFCKTFDNKHTNDIIHPFDFSRIDTVPQIALRGNCYIKEMHGIKDVTLKYSEPFKNAYVWHQDIVGHGTHTPPIVSSMYMIKTPPKGGDTLFASMEDAYDNIDYKLKDVIKDLNSIYTNTNNEMMNSYFDYTGYNSLKKEDYTFNSKWTSILNRESLVVYSDSSKKRKTLMLSPFRFTKFDNLSHEDSYELYRELMCKYILQKDNIINIKWQKNDLLLFNNRKLIHTSSPTIEYQGYERLYYSCFLGTRSPIYRCNSY